MKTNEKQIVVTAIIIIASFLCGSLVTARFTNKYAYPVSSDQVRASLWDRLFGSTEADTITEMADVISLVLDQIEKIHDLETRITVLEKCGPECEHKFPPPDYDSGWHPIAKNEHLTLQHNLNTLDYLVYVMQKDDEAFNEFHNFGTGGAFIEDYQIDVIIDAGTMWTASQNSIEIYRYNDDSVSDYVRVLLWKIPT
jgi:hypothetical protein